MALIMDIKQCQTCAVHSWWGANGGWLADWLGTFLYCWHGLVS